LPHSGFKRVAFAEREADKVVVVVGRDGKLTLEGKATTAERIKSSLAEKAKAANGPDKVEIAIHAHPLVKYAVVSRLLHQFKQSGYRNIEVSSQEAERPK
jgi:biopolymer transport protein ExbD